MNGAVGVLDAGFFSIESTEKSADIFFSKNFWVSSSESKFLGKKEFIGSLALLKNKAWVLNDSLGMKLLISLSLSTINLTDTDCTLPADNPPLTFLHNTGDNS